MKTVKRISLVVILLALLITGASSIVITHENEYSLIRQFGRIDHVVAEAGVSFKIPFIQSVDTLPKQTLLYDLSPSDVITSDKKTMICDSYILWRIVDPQKFAQTLNSSIPSAENRLDAIVYYSTKTVISSTPQDDVISGRGGALSSAIIANIGTSLEQYGIELLSFEIKKLDLPSDNKAAVYERMISERDNIAATYTAEGSTEAQKIIFHNGPADLLPISPALPANAYDKAQLRFRKSLPIGEAGSSDHIPALLLHHSPYTEAK